MCSLSDAATQMSDVPNASLLSWVITTHNTEIEKCGVVPPNAFTFLIIEHSR
jgi:hypothetical protein